MSADKQILRTNEGSTFIGTSVWNSGMGAGESSIWFASKAGVYLCGGNTKVQCALINKEETLHRQSKNTDSKLVIAEV